MKQEIIETVQHSPGIHFRCLTRELDISPSTVDYHFERTDELRDRDIRGYRRIYPVDVSKRHDSSLAALNHPLRSRVLYSIEKEDIRGFSEIHELVDVSKSTLSTHINVLSDADLVRVEKKGNRKYYDVSDPVRDAFRNFTTFKLDDMESKFIDMWD